MWFPLEMGISARSRKTTMMGLLNCQNSKSFKIGLAVYRRNDETKNTIPTCDRRTDGQTPHDGKDRAMQSVVRVKITRFVEIIVNYC